MIIAGPPGSGKSQCIQTLVDALCVTPRGLSRHSQRSTPANTAETNHKLQKINPPGGGRFLTHVRLPQPQPRLGGGHLHLRLEKG